MVVVECHDAHHMKLLMIEHPAAFESTATHQETANDRRVEIKRVSKQGKHLNMLMNRYAMGCFLKSLVMKPTFSLLPATQFETK